MTRAPLPSELVECLWCGAKAEEPCTDGAGRVSQRSHRARIVLACVGTKNAAAVARIDKILDEARRRQTPKNGDDDGQH